MRAKINEMIGRFVVYENSVYFVGFVDPKTTLVKSEPKPLPCITAQAEELAALRPWAL